MLESLFQKIARSISRQYGVRVVVEGDEAYTDSKTIYIPDIDIRDNAEKERQIHGYLDHEVAHCLFTDFSKKSKNNYIHNLYNFIEDVRIEKEMIQKYPGSFYNLEPLRKDLYEKNQNSIQSTNTDFYIYQSLDVIVSLIGCIFQSKMFEKLKLYPKIQTIYKIDNNVIKFIDNNFYKLVDEACLCNNSEEALSVAEKLYKHLVKNKKSNDEKIYQNQIDEMIKKVINDLKQEEEKEKQKIEDNLKNEFNEKQKEKDNKSSQNENNVENQSDLDSSDKKENQAKSESSNKKENKLESGSSNKKDDPKDKHNSNSASNQESIDKEQELLKQEIEKTQKQIEKDYEKKKEEQLKNIDQILKDQLQKDEKDQVKNGEIEIKSPKDLFEDIVQNPSESFEPLKSTDLSSKSINKEYLVKKRIKLNKIINKFYLKLEKILSVTTKSKVKLEQEKGLVHTANLHKVLTKQNYRTPFKEKIKNKTNKIACSILIDCSGSMNDWGKRECALDTAFVLSEIFNKYSISHEIASFDTNYFLLKRFEQPGNGNLLSYSPDGGTDLGPSLKKAALNLLQRNEKRKIIFIISDGATSHENFCQSVFKDVHKKLEVVSFGVLSNEIKKFDKKAIYLKDPNDLLDSALDHLENILVKNAKVF